jgi:hypothetical protein
MSTARSRKYLAVTSSAGRNASRCSSAFEDAVQAYRYFRDGNPFGKVVVELPAVTC